MTPNRVQRGADKKRRAPLALLVVPVVLVAIGVGIFLMLRGGDVPIIGGSDGVTPPFDFIVAPAAGVATVSDADKTALAASADQVAREITPTIDDLFTNAYLDPSNWKHDDYEEVFATFAPDAVGTAEQSVETLTLGANAGDVFDTVDPGKSKLDYEVLFDPDGNPDTAVVTVIFRATGERKDGTYLAIVSEGEFFLRQIDGWKITAFDVTRDDHEAQPPSPSASASPSV
ncbi:MAG: hypothetical protein WB297_07160 [Actinomycetota bacterium]